MIDTANLFAGWQPTTFVQFVERRINEQSRNGRKVKYSFGRRSYKLWREEVRKASPKLSAVLDDETIKDTAAIQSNMSMFLLYAEKEPQDLNGQPFQYRNIPVPNSEPSKLRRKDLTAIHRFEQLLRGYDLISWAANVELTSRTGRERRFMPPVRSGSFHSLLGVSESVGLEVEYTPEGRPQFKLDRDLRPIENVSIDRIRQCDDCGLGLDCNHKKHCGRFFFANMSNQRCCSLNCTKKRHRRIQEQKAS